MASESSLQWWRDKWEGDTPFWHKQEANPNLFDNFHYLNDGSKKPQDAGLMFLPMCGKAIDMKYLYQKGYRVFGIDCAKKAVREFFDENKIKYELKHDEKVGDVYSTPDGRLRIVCGDIFKLTPEIVGEPVTLIWDRGALGAVDKETRKKYAEVVCSLVAPGAKYLVEALQYDDWYYSGPPRNIPPKLVDSLYDAHFEIKQIAQIDITERASQNLSVSPVFQNVFLLVAKSK